MQNQHASEHPWSTAESLAIQRTGFLQGIFLFMMLRPPTLPCAPRSIQKGTPLKVLLNQEAIECLAQNILYVHNDFEGKAFCEHALAGLEQLELMQRGQHIAKALHRYLSSDYSEAIGIIMASLTPAQAETEGSGLAGFFYLPHSFFISDYGQD